VVIPNLVIAPGWPTVLAIILLVPAIGGPTLVALGPFARCSFNWASKSGMGIGVWFYASEIPWVQVTSIVVDLRHGQPKRYTVLGRSGSVPISWPASAETLPMPQGDVHPITPAELAELVSRRAGVPISRREG
jgi:hypothetical protein